MTTSLIACGILLVGCTAAENTNARGADIGGTSSAEITTSWTPPADPEEQGPTEPPALPEVTGSLGDEIALPTRMSVSIAEIATKTIEAVTPGEYSGSAVVVTVVVKNSASEAQDVGSAVVTLVTDDGEMGIPTWSDPNEPLRGPVAPGARAEGIYVFMLDSPAERPVKITVNYGAGEPVATFSGTTR